jgi:hypothetical protein
VDSRPKCPFYQQTSVRHPEKLPKETPNPTQSSPDPPKRLPIGIGQFLVVLAVFTPGSRIWGIPSPSPGAVSAHKGNRGVPKGNPEIYTSAQKGNRGVPKGNPEPYTSTHKGNRGVPKGNPETYTFSPFSPLCTSSIPRRNRPP